VALPAGAVFADVSRVAVRGKSRHAASCAPGCLRRHGLRQPRQASDLHRRNYPDPAAPPGPERRAGILLRSINMIAGAQAPTRLISYFHV